MKDQVLDQKFLDQKIDKTEKSTIERIVTPLETAPVKSLEPKLINMLLGTSGEAVWRILEFSVMIEVGTVTLTPCMFVI